MNHEDVPGVQAHPLAPALRQWRDLVVGRVDAIQVALPEHAQGRQVGLGVRALRHRVNEHADHRRPAGWPAHGCLPGAGLLRPEAGPRRRPLGGLIGRGPQDIAAPQIPVRAGHRDPRAALTGSGAHEGRLVGVEVAVAQTLAQPLDDSGPAGADRAVVPTGLQVGQDPVLGVELAPAARLALLDGVRPQPDVRAAHLRPAVPAGRRRPEGRGARGVGDGQRPTEGLRPGRRHGGCCQSRLLQPARAAGHRHHVCPAVGHRLGEPGQALRLQGGGDRAVVVLAEDTHGPSLPGPPPPREGAGSYDGGGGVWGSPALAGPGLFPPDQAKRRDRPRR